MNYLVNTVTDGDTFDIVGHVTYNGRNFAVIRLDGLNAPEEGKNGYEVAKSYLRTLIGQKRVGIRGLAIGYYDRLIAEVTCNGKSVNQQMKTWLKQNGY